jgi:uncharacterized protein (DUF58 family)
MSDATFPYLDLSALETLRRVTIAPRNLTEGTYSGPFTSRYQGMSVEFADYRNYVPGDDIRLVDWKVFARNDRHYIKLFEAERNFVAHIALDNSASMAYAGTINTTPSKWEYACKLAAALGYIVIRDGNALGLALGSADLERYERPSNFQRHLSHLLSVVAKTRTSGKTDLAVYLESLFTRIRLRSILIVISDFFDQNSDIWRVINLFRRSRFDVLLFQVLHPEELNLPDMPSARFFDMEDRDLHFKVDIDAIREAYQAKLDRFIKSMKDNAAIRGCEFYLARTDMDPYKFIKRCFL